jgi:hypothetical protein
MRIYRDRYYLLRVRPGLSGFKRYDQWEYYITTGHKARNDRTRVVEEYKRCSKGAIFRLEDGHLPDYQPRASEADARASEADALQWLDNNPYQRIVRV